MSGEPLVRIEDLSVTFRGGRAPVRAVAACSARGSVSQTATSSARPAWRPMASKWLAEILPQPTSAKRTGRPVIGWAALMTGPGFYGARPVPAPRIAGESTGPR